MSEAIARVHVNDRDPEIYTGYRALVMAEAAAELFRRDRPDAVIGVSYNETAAEDARRDPGGYPRHRDQLHVSVPRYSARARRTDR